MKKVLYLLVALLIIAPVSSFALDSIEVLLIKTN